MRKVLALVLAAAVVALLHRVLWPPARIEPPPPAGAGRGGQPASGARAAEPGQAGADRPTVRLAQPALPAPSAGDLLARVLWSDGTPAAGLWIVVEPAFRTAGAWQHREAITGADGSALVRGLAPGEGQLRADWRCGKAFAIVAGQTAECSVRLPAGVAVHGIVVDGAGAPVPAARIWLSRPGSGDEGQEICGVAPDGTFALRDLPVRGCFVAALAPGHRVSPLVRIGGAAGGTQQVRIELREPGLALCGRVWAPDGRPAAGARVLVGDRAPMVAWHRAAATAGRRPPVERRCDAQGRFCADGLEAGDTATVWVRAGNSATLRREVQLPAEGDGDVELQLRAGALVRGRAADPGGAPLGGVAVQAHSDAVHDPDAEEAAFAGPAWALSWASSAADGSYEIAHVGAGAVRLTARQDRPPRSAAAAIRAEDATQVQWDPVLTAGACIRGAVVRGSQPLAGWTVSAASAQRAAAGRRATTDAQGRFVLEDCGGHGWRLAVLAPGAFHLEPSAVRTGVRAGAAELRIEVPAGAVADARLAGRVAAADGGSLTDPELCWWRAGAVSLRHAPIAGDGEFAVGLLPAGRYRVRLLAERERGAWSEPFDLRAGEIRDLGTLRPAPCGGVRAMVLGADGRPLEGAECRIVARLGEIDQVLASVRTGRGAAACAGLPCGDYLLCVRGAELPSVQVPFRVEARRQTELAVTVPAGVACRLRLSPPSGGAPQLLSFGWTRDGALAEQDVEYWLADTETVRVLRLLPGSYELAVTGESGRRAVTGFGVPADAAAAVEVAVRLP